MNSFLLFKIIDDFVDLKLTDSILKCNFVHNILKKMVSPLISNYRN